MAMLKETFRLNTGHLIPKIGLGTFMLSGSACLEVVKTALRSGVLHIDTSQLYQNESTIAEAMRDYDRKSIFIGSKVGDNQQGYEQAKAACLNSLESLKTDYLDLMLVNWPGVRKMKPSDPQAVEMRHGTWRALEEMHQEGKIRSIGVSNFLQRHLEKLFDVCKIPPSVNQIEYHPLCHDDELVRYCKDRNIVVEAYSSLARADPDLWGNSKLKEIAQKYNKSIAQILLRWGYQKDLVIIPKTSKPERVADNIDIDFGIADNDMQIIDSFHTGKRIIWDPNRIVH